MAFLLNSTARRSPHDNWPLKLAVTKNIQRMLQNQGPTMVGMGLTTLDEFRAQAVLISANAWLHAHAQQSTSELASKEICQRLYRLLELVAAGVVQVTKWEKCSRMCCAYSMSPAELQSRHKLSS